VAEKKICSVLFLDGLSWDVLESLTRALLGGAGGEVKEKQAFSLLSNVNKAVTYRRGTLHVLKMKKKNPK
jgi:hypothetical protein